MKEKKIPQYSQMVVQRDKRAQYNQDMKKARPQLISKTSRKHPKLLV